MPATHAAHSDQASRAAVRAVTRPLGCRGQLPTTPRSLIAKAGSSDGTFTYSKAAVRLGLLDIILPGDRPGIVTDFATSTCLAWVCDPASQVSNQLSDGPLA
jgi:guanyl-specific ribonuclease Sa